MTVHRYFYKDIHFFNPMLYAERIWDTQTRFFPELIKMDMRKIVDEKQTSFYLRDNIQSGIYSTRPMDAEKVNTPIFSSELIFTGEDLKNGLEYQTSGDHVGTPRTGMMNTEEEINVSGKCNSPIVIEQIVCVGGQENQSLTEDRIIPFSRDMQSAENIDQIYLATRDIVVDLNENKDVANELPQLEVFGCDDHIGKHTNTLDVQNDLTGMDYREKILDKNEEVHVGIPVKQLAPNEYGDNVGNPGKILDVTGGDMVGIPIKSILDDDSDHMLGTNDKELLTQNKDIHLGVPTKSIEEGLGDFVGNSDITINSDDIDERVDENSIGALINTHSDNIASRLKEGAAERYNVFVGGDMIGSHINSFWKIAELTQKELSDIRMEMNVANQHNDLTYDKEQSFLDKHTKSLQSNRNLIFTYKHTNEIFWHDWLFAERENKQEIFQLDFNFYGKCNNETDFVGNEVVDKYAPNIRTDASDVLASMEHKSLLEDDGTMFYDFGKTIVLNEESVHVWRTNNTPIAYIELQDLISKNLSPTETPYEDMLLSKTERAIGEPTDLTSGVTKSGSSTYKDTDTTTYSKGSHSANEVSDDIAITKTTRPIVIAASQVYLDKTPRNIFGVENMTFTPDGRSLYADDISYNFTPDGRNTVINTTSETVSLPVKRTYYDRIISAQKIRKNGRIESNTESIHKVPKILSIEETSVHANIADKILNLKNFELLIGKYPRLTHIVRTSDFIYKVTKRLNDLVESLFVSETIMSLFNDDKDSNVYKVIMPVVTESTDGFIDKADIGITRHLELLVSKDVETPVFEQSIVGLSRNDKGITSTTDLSVQKSDAGIYTTSQTTALKIGKPVYGFSNITTEKSDIGIILDQSQSFAERDNERPVDDRRDYLELCKADIGTFMQEIVAAKKDALAIYMTDTSVGTIKEPFDTRILKTSKRLIKMPLTTRIIKTSVFANKNYRPTNLAMVAIHVTKSERDTQLFGGSKWFKVPKREGRMFFSLTAAPTIRNAITNKMDTLSKVEYNGDLSNQTVLLEHAERESLIFNQHIGFNKSADMAIRKNLMIHRPYQLDAIENILIPTQTEDKLPTNVDDIRLAEKQQRDTQLDRQSGFGYIEKPDYAKIKDDRVDELLLPASDFNYSKFAEELVVDGSVNPQYIKRIDDDGRIFVTLPIKHPIRHFADLAIHYVDLNVGLLIYIIEKAYNIWQNNIFTYSAMASDQALNDILKKLHQNLFIQYPSEEDQYQLHRAIRLFRWYSEMSILNNSEYMLKLEYDDIGIDYANKDTTPMDVCTHFTNLRVDDTFVLTPIDILQPCEIVISMHRQHDVTLHGKLIITGGTCVINVNGKVDTYEEQVLDLEQVLEHGPNNVSITFTPSADAYFGVTGMKIDKYTIKSYSVSYVGKIGESNPTINQLITMLLVCGDSIDDIQRTVAHATPTANALDQLRVYFDLHHEEKLKGKRLTIRK